MSMAVLVACLWGVLVSRPTGLEARALAISAVVALIEVCAVALFQEIVFRGLLPRLFGRWLGVWGSAIATSLLFAAVHIPQLRGITLGLDLAGLAGLFAFGMLCAVSVWRTGAVWWAIGFHGAWNFTQLWVFGLPTYGGAFDAPLFRLAPARPDDWLSGGAFGPEASPLALALLTVLGLAWSWPGHSRHAPRH